MNSVKDHLVSIILITGLAVALSIVLLSGSNNRNISEKVSPDSIKESVEIKDGIQYVTIDAKGGYWPKVSNAKAGIPTKLIVKTNGTYDCSASLVIHSLGYQKILSQTGEEIIDLGIPKAGVPIQGLCGMGMYNFTIDFS